MTNMLSLIFHFTHDAGKPAPGSSQKMHISQAEEILNKQSGWKALTGTTDFGHISSSADPECRLAFDIFVDRIVGFVGGYYVKLEGKVDALIFAGGIGEKADLLRQRVVEKCQCLGFEIDEQRNRSPIHCAVEDIGSGNARHRTLVCQTDEQVGSSPSITHMTKTDGPLVRNGKTVCPDTLGMLVAHSSMLVSSGVAKTSVVNLPLQDSRTSKCRVPGSCIRTVCYWTENNHALGLASSWVIRRTLLTIIASRPASACIYHWLSVSSNHHEEAGLASLGVPSHTLGHHSDRHTTRR